MLVSFSKQPKKRKMRMVQRKYIRYSTLGDLVIYSNEGIRASGVTLAAVKQLVGTQPKKIVTNIKMCRVDSEKLNKNTLPEHDCTLFIDNAEVVINSRRTSPKENELWCHLLTQGKKRNVKIILGARALCYLDRRIRESYTTLLVPRFFKTRDGTPKMYLYRYNPKKPTLVVKYGPWNMRKYFKYFNTLEIVKIGSSTTGRGMEGAL